MLVEVREAKEALEGGFAHVECVGEAHVVFDESDDLLRLFVGKVEASKDDFCDSDTDFDVAIEADAVIRVGRIRWAVGGGLADVVKERSPGECG